MADVDADGDPDVLATVTDVNGLTTHKLALWRNAGDGTLGQMLVDESLHTEAKDALRTVTRATQSVEDQSAISLLGTIVTSLF